MAHDDAAVHTISDVVELVELVSLDDVFVHEERGRRIDVTAPAEDEANAEDDGSPRIKNLLGVSEMEGDDRYGIAFRFRIVFDDRTGNEFVADIEARYGLEKSCKISEAIKAEFAEQVGFFAVYPYLRASLQMTASRMAAPAPVLGIVRRGEFELGERMTDDQTRFQFKDTAPEV